MSRIFVAALLVAGGVFVPAIGQTTAAQAFVQGTPQATVQAAPETAPQEKPHATAQATPQAAPPAALKDKYHGVEVEKFDVQKDVEFPPEYIQPLQDEIVKEFQKEKFKEVLRGGENPTDAAVAVLRLVGTVTYFDPGSRKKRYVGFGMGAAEVQVHVAFVDRASGETILTDDVRGVLEGGLFGGESKDVTHQFAQQLGNTTKLMLEKPVPAHIEAAAEPTAGGATPMAASRHVVKIDESFEKAERDMNVEASGGYRLAGFTQKGKKKADIAMELSATRPQMYQYRLLHVQWMPNLQKDLNNAGKEGYRFCLHTLAQIHGAVAFAIIEKAPGAAKTRYEYHVRTTMLLSSAQKDIQKDQSEGFNLVETGELSGMHFVIMEKTVVGE